MVETILQILAIIGVAMLLGGGPLALIALSNRKHYQASVKTTGLEEARAAEDASLHS